MKSLIIAEAGVNHNGKLDLALRLCDAAKEAGADVVKFQTFKTTRVLTRSAEMAAYQKENLRKQSSQFEMIQALELAFSDFETILRHCRDIGIEFLSTPDDEESLEFLVTSLGLETVKVGSGEVSNIPYLRKVGRYHRDVVLSTGMSTIGEVDRALSALLQGGARSVALLHCTTNYPCPPEEVNLYAMVTLRNAFKTVVGYSDHSLGISVAVAAVALGAEILEKHLTLDNAMTGPDHSASLEPGEFEEMVRSIRIVETALGDGIKRPSASEFKNRTVVHRSIVAVRGIAKGELLSEENIALKRAGGQGMPPELWDFVLGRTAIRDFNPDEAIEI